MERCEFGMLYMGFELAALAASREGALARLDTAVRRRLLATSHQGADKLLHVVRGLEVTTLAQVHQSLFNPDLVREALAGDPHGEVKRAAEVVNLEKVLDSGPGAGVEIARTARQQSGADLVTVAARITDRGKGIGRIEWRVNGVTAGVIERARRRRGRTTRSSENSRSTLARTRSRSSPMRAQSAGLASCADHDHLQRPGRCGEAETACARHRHQHYTSIEGWIAARQLQNLAFPPLNLAVADAKAFGAELEKAGAGLYSEVRVTSAR